MVLYRPEVYKHIHESEVYRWLLSLFYSTHNYHHSNNQQKYSYCDTVTLALFLCKWWFNTIITSYMTMLLGLHAFVLPAGPSL